MKHIKPRYHGYHGGYTTVTICLNCDTIALYEDRHPVDPCPDCGSRLVEGVGKYETVVVEKYPTWMFWKRNKKVGRWILKS